ncbi:Fe-S oxidoreductase [Leucobacter sp. HY1910]
MQLGARWRAGDAPHRGVPPVLYSAIAEQEAAYPAASAWTLTFLEGRPRCTLDDAVTVGLDAAGAVTVEAVQSLTTGGSAPGSGAAADASTVSGVPDDDDDDWLS